MFETIVLILFTVMLTAAMLLHIPLYITLAAGLVLFLIYGLIKGHSPKSLALMASQGLKTIGPIMLLFVVIGMLTAIWRAAGTISYITCWSSHVINPGSLVVLAFLICAMMSVLTGSSVASAATVGVVCMTIANAMGANQAFIAGAVISGAFVGDRCSPLSSSALLTATLTRTELFHNLNRSFRISIVPLLLTCFIYIGLGFTQTSAGIIPEFETLFEPNFTLSWVLILPTIVIIVLSILKVPVKRTMLVSLIVGIFICLFIQHIPLQEIPGILLFGYYSNNPAIAEMIDGGGILSLVPIALVVSIASTFSGIFEGTGLLENLRKRIKQLARKTTPFVGVLTTSLLTTMITCDQMLSIMLTKQLCDELEYKGEALALDLSNSAVVVSGFIPWSTVCIAIIAFLEAPSFCVLAASYTYIIPLWFLSLSLYQRRHPNFFKTKVGQILGFNEYDDIRQFVNFASLEQQ